MTPILRNKPHGPLGRPSAALDAAFGYDWPDYKENPLKWDKRARTYMAGALARNQIVSKFTVDRLINLTLSAATEENVMGDHRKVLRIFGKVCREYEAEKREVKDNKLTVEEYCQSRGLDDEETQRIMHKAIPHGFANVDGYKTEADKLALKKREKAGKGFYETGFEPNIAAATALANAEAERLRQVEADNAAARALADELFPRDNKQEETVSDINETLGDVAAAQADDDKPLHFSQVDGFYSKVAKRFQKRKDSAVIKDYMQTVKDWFERASFTEFEMTEDAFFAMLDNELMLRFDKAKPAETKKIDEKAVFSPEKSQQVSEVPLTVKQSTETPAQVEEKSNAPAVSEPQKTAIELPTPSPLLTSLKTLTGIPVTQITHYMNKKHDQKYYKNIKAKNGQDHWTDIDPVAVRKRFEKVFGPHGLGWRIVPAQGGGQVICTPYTQKTSAGKERQMYAVSMCSFVLEYALVTDAGKIEYVQSSAFSDADDNDDMGYAHRGAFTGLMKQALKMFGGYDHFIDKAA